MSKLTVIKEAAEKAFDAERDRTDYHISKAEKFIAAITLVMAFQVHEAKDLVKETPFTVPVCISLGLLALSLFFTLLAMRIRRFIGYSAGTELKELLEDQEADDQKAGQELADVLIEARDHNAGLNDRNATLLRIAGWLLLAGFLLVIGIQIAAVFKEG